MEALVQILEANGIARNQGGYYTLNMAKYLDLVSNNKIQMQASENRFDYALCWRLLYVLAPRKEAGISFGLGVERVKEVFTPWFEIERVERGSFWDRNSPWFWMRKKGEITR